MNKTGEALDEEMITAWVQLTGALKNSRITQGLNYNEAIVMLIAYHRYRKDGEGLVSFKEIVSQTKMLKSLVNRTIGSVERKGLLERCEGKDKRTTFVRPVKNRLDAFLAVHDRSLALAHAITEVIGEEDANTFLQLSQKVVAADPLPRLD